MPAISTDYEKRALEEFLPTRPSGIWWFPAFKKIPDFTLMYRIYIEEA